MPPLQASEDVVVQHVRLPSNAEDPKQRRRLLNILAQRRYSMLHRDMAAIIRAQTNIYEGDRKRARDGSHVRAQERDESRNAVSHVAGRDDHAVLEQTALQAPTSVNASDEHPCPLSIRGWHGSSSFDESDGGAAMDLVIVVFLARKHI